MIELYDIKRENPNRIPELCKKFLGTPEAL